MNSKDVFSMDHEKVDEKYFHTERERFEKIWALPWKDHTEEKTAAFQGYVDFLMAHHITEASFLQPLQKAADELKTLAEISEDLKEENVRLKETEALAVRQGNLIKDILSGKVPLSTGLLLKELFGKCFKMFSVGFWKERRRKKAIEEQLKAEKMQQAASFRLLVENILSEQKVDPVNTVCVLAPMFSDKNIRDGYYQRIKAIDEEILTSQFKIYVDPCNPSKAMTAELKDDRHLVVFLDLNHSEQNLIWKRILQRCKLVYIHSVYRVMENSFSAEARNILAQSGKKVIWDVHGAVPEEIEMTGRTEYLTMAEEAESFLVRHSDLIVVVNRATQRHLEKKYGAGCRSEFVVLPIFNQSMLEKIDCSTEKVSDEQGRPTAIYAGGMQPWQKIELLQDVVAEANDGYRYKLYVSDPKAFIEMWGERSKPEQMLVDTVPPEQLAVEYRSCHYGFVLRDDTVVNNVACPTKLIEYLQYGIIPVLDTPNIGDFVEMGMQYINYHAFCSQKKISETERLNMVNCNNQVLNRLLSAHQKGKAALQNKIQD